MASVIEIGFNKSLSSVMYVDINSCFATVEQQANPLLRNKPLVVVAYNTPNGCILAASVDAKKKGVKTGMRVKEAKKLCPYLLTVSTDPEKYRVIHDSFYSLLSLYTPKMSARSIDEFALDFSRSSYLKGGLFDIAGEIKKRIKEEIGDYLTVSIGIAPTYFLAKTASNLQKPDGLEEINYQNYREIYQNLSLTDLTGIASKNNLRLKGVGIETVLDFYNAPINILERAFGSKIVSRHWYLRLRGREVDDIDWPTKSFGHTYTLAKPVSKEEALPILSKLSEKVGYRLRKNGYQTKGIHLGLRSQNYHGWHHGQTLDSFIYSSSDIYEVAKQLLQSSPVSLIRNIFLTCFSLSAINNLQLDLFGERDKKSLVTKALDEIENKWGRFSIFPATMAGTEKLVPDRIGFNNKP